MFVVNPIPRPIPRITVLGLPGRVFGRHWHQRKGSKVPLDHPDWEHNVRIQWQLGYDIEKICYPDSEPILLANQIPWRVFTSNLQTVEETTGFLVREHCRQLVRTTPPYRRPVILEWGCGAGNAVRDLTTDPQIVGRALIFGYSDVWDKCWNSVDGVKFLFFVKEHLTEFFRRSKLKIDFIFTHFGLEHLNGDDQFDHLRDLASILSPGGVIVLPDPSSVLFDLSDVFQIKSIYSGEVYSGDHTISGPYLLIKKGE